MRRLFVEIAVRVCDLVVDGSADVVTCNAKINVQKGDVRSRNCGPQCSFNIKDAFTCQSSGLVYAISCRRCSAIYIGETGRTLRERFGEHLRSIEKNLPGFPVAEHFNANGHALQDAQVRGVMPCGGNKLRKRQEMRLIFQLGTSQPHGLNSDFRYL
ncbi:hypothetical protein ACROYT_G028594 [Oculina patagonica]